MPPQISAKTGLNVEDVVRADLEKIPAPTGRCGSAAESTDL